MVNKLALKAFIFLRSNFETAKIIYSHEHLSKTLNKSKHPQLCRLFLLRNELRISLFIL